jgi:hypothetical protein
MKRRFKEIFPKIVIGMMSIFTSFLVGVGIYTPFSENSYFYNLAYAIGYIEACIF